MKGKFRLTINALMWAIILMAAYAVTAETPTSAKKNKPPETDASQVITPATSGPNFSAPGNGTLSVLNK